MSKLDEIEARAKAATAGPWRVGWPSNGGEDQNYILRSRGSRSPNVDDWKTIVSGAADDWGIEQGVRKPEDAIFIAKARKDVPLLTRAVRQLGAVSVGHWKDGVRAYYNGENWVPVDLDVLELLEEEA